MSARSAAYMSTSVACTSLEIGVTTRSHTHILPLWTHVVIVSHYGRVVGEEVPFGAPAT